VKLIDLIPKKAILPALKATDKKSAIQELVRTVWKTSDGDKFAVEDIVNAIVQREKIGSTGVGGGVGVPHAKLDSIRNVVGAFGRTSAGLDFNAVDGEPVHVIFLILAPTAKVEPYLQALQKVMGAIKRPNFVKFLKNAKSVKDIEEIFREVEEVAV
jgi:mannitol/fructose-specific phosphotransferase system IIA component (Ntr-type)